MMMIPQQHQHSHQQSHHMDHQQMHHNGVAQQQSQMDYHHHVQFKRENMKWNTNQEIAQILFAAPHHPEWKTNHPVERPNSGTQLLFNRYDGNWFKVDGFEWKKRREGKLIREDHMKLKVNKQEIISANYAHSSVVPTFHRRVYWLTNNPEYVLVHYLNLADTESTSDRQGASERMAASIRANGLSLNQTQIQQQISPICAGSMNQHDITSICEGVWRCLTGQNGNQASHSQAPGSFPLERRNSCSSAFRSGLSSMALRRQPSTFSDSVDANYIGGVNSVCAPDLPCSSHNGYNKQTVDSRSHSGETQRSSNQDEEMSLCRQQSLSARSTSNGAASQASFHLDTQPSTSYSRITEINPSTASMRGGTKVLIIGGWYMKGHEYSVLFGDRRVPAKLIQVGVLSVIVPPALSVGAISIRVLCNGKIVSSPSDFVYTAEEEIGESGDLMQALVDRLFLLMGAFNGNDARQESSSLPASLDEMAMVMVVNSLAGRLLRFPSLLMGHPSLPSRTVLHLAAALNFNQLLEHLLTWKSRHNLLSLRELDLLARDCEGRTPLHVAVRAGNFEAASVIVRFDRSTLDVLDDRGRTPYDMSSDGIMRRLTDRNMQRDEDEQMLKDGDDVEHVTSTALWVLTNGETVTGEHLLRRSNRAEGDMSSRASSSVSSGMHAEDIDDRPGPSGMSRWRDEPLHVEISMDTDVHLPDSPKMADLFEAVTSPGIVNAGARAKMAILAQQILDALPDKIKEEAERRERLESSISLIDDDSMVAGGSGGFSFPSDDNTLLSHMMSQQDVWGGDEIYGMNTNNQRFSNEVVRCYEPIDSRGEDGPSTSMSNQQNGSSFDHNHLYPNKGANSSLASSRTNTFESASFDFDKDLGDFFNICMDSEVDPIQQRLGGLKLTHDEQREVYEAAMVIQRAYREYRARNSNRDRDRADVERKAAVTIQSCYRRYKQFCYFKKLHNAAIVVQKHFRLKKVNQKEQAECSQSEVPEHPTLDGQSIRIQVPQNNSSLLREHRAATTIQHAYRGHRKRQAAARKIQRFMKESRLNSHPNIIDAAFMAAEDTGAKRRRTGIRQGGALIEQSDGRTVTNGGGTMPNRTVTNGAMPNMHQQQQQQCQWTYYPQQHEQYNYEWERMNMSYDPSMRPPE